MIATAAVADRSIALADVSVFRPREGVDASRGAIPEWSNRFAVMAWSDWLRYDAIVIAPDVPIPTFVVHGEGAAIPDGAKRFIAGLRVPKGSAWIDGTQFDFYDREQNVAASIEHAIAHFESNGA